MLNQRYHLAPFSPYNSKDQKQSQLPRLQLSFADSVVGIRHISYNLVAKSRYKLSSNKYVSIGFNFVFEIVIRIGAYRGNGTTQIINFKSDCLLRFLDLDFKIRFINEYLILYAIYFKITIIQVCYYNYIGFI